MADENPAANNPIPKAHEAHTPILFCKVEARTGNDVNEPATVPARRMKAVINPPSVTDITNPTRISETVLPLLMADPRKIL